MASIALLGLTFAGQAFAQGVLTCNGAIQATVNQTVSPSPFFEGDTLRMKVDIGADDIEGGVDNVILIPSFSYFLDCGALDTWPTCNDPIANDIAFVNVVSTTCENVGGDLINWTTTNANEVLFTAQNGPVEQAANSKCEVQFDITLNTVGVVPPTVRQRFGFNTASCDNGEPGGSQGGLSFGLSTCEIDLRKEVSVNGGVDWFDANGSPGPSVEYPPGDALYRLIVDNTGTANFVGDITYNDGDLGIVSVELPSGGLTPGADPLIITQGEISQLNAEGRCTATGAIDNTASADALCRLDSPVGDSDSDDAWLNCVPEPDISIKKYVSVNGGTTYFDANEVDKTDWPPLQVAPAGARYKIEVCNEGGVALTNVTVNDAKLGIENYDAGDLTVDGEGRCVTLKDGDIEGKLIVAEVCDEAEIFNNIASAQGESALIAGSLTGVVTDPANVECGVPAIDITKEVYDGTTWVDANAAPGPYFLVGSTISYRLYVCNTGDIDLDPVTVEDTKLGIPLTDIGALAAGDCTTIDSGDITALDSSAACENPGLFTNTAYAYGEVGDGEPTDVSDNDPANVTCLEPDAEISKQCRPDPVAVGQTISWAITIENTGDVDLECLVDDPDAEVVAEACDPVVGDSCTVNASRTVVEADAPTISNSATATCTSGDYAGVLLNLGPATADCEVTVVDEICRTPGFWGTHAGTEKEGRSTNLTQVVIDAVGSLSICGQTIDNTNLEDTMSALEAMCVHPKGDQKYQLVRQLTAAALNCVISGGGADCSGVSVYDDFTAANAACQDPNGDHSYWIGIIDDFNNGVDSNCHDAPLTDSDVFAGIDKVPGPAGSSRACNDAIQNDTYVVTVP